MATAQVKQHDYHLVDPSPWPFVGSVSAFIMAFGAIAWMHHMFAAAPYIFGVGVDKKIKKHIEEAGGTVELK